MKLRLIIRSVVLGAFITAPCNADNCREFLTYSEQDRTLAALEILTNARPTEKITIALLLDKACKGQIPDFPRSVANDDAGKLLPYLRKQKISKKSRL